MSIGSRIDSVAKELFHVRYANTRMFGQLQSFEMRYEPSLDGLRAFSVLSVVICHISEDSLPGGWAGVDTFFVLSGYLITRLLAGELVASGKINYRQFYIRRALRLGPALVCLLAFVVLLVLYFRDINLLRAAALSLIYMMNWNRAFGWFPPTLLGHTWSLSMEEQFYVLWPGLFSFVHKRRPILWLTLAFAVVTAWRVILASAGADPERTYNGFDTHSDGLLLGCIIALLSRHRLGAVLSKGVVIPVVGMLLIFRYLDVRTYFAETAGFLMSAIFAAWIILALEHDSWLKKFLSAKPFVFTGRISYGWYLWHFPIIRLALYAMTRIHTSISEGTELIVVDGACFVLSYMVAVLSYRYVETPFLRLKKRYEFRRDRPLDSTDRSRPVSELTGDFPAGGS